MDKELQPMDEKINKEIDDVVDVITKIADEIQACGGEIDRDNLNENLEGFRKSMTTLYYMMARAEQIDMFVNIVISKNIDVALVKISRSANDYNLMISNTTTGNTINQSEFEFLKGIIEMKKEELNKNENISK